MKKPMKKKAIIFDLDNTIYPVSSIGEKLFDDLFRLIEEDGRFSGDFDNIKDSIQKKPFQAVAKEFHFDDELTAKALEALSDLEYNDVIEPFDDYLVTRGIDRLKFLVTTGFTKLQWSKIRRMGLEKDFEACFVVDPAMTDRTKKHIFAEIMEEYKLQSEDVLVIGDDIQSEIKAGKELGIDTVLYDHKGKYSGSSGYEGNVISNYNSLAQFI